MKSRQAKVRKRERGGEGSGRRLAKRNRLLSVRSALVLSLAFLAAIGGAGLLFAAHRPAPLIALGTIAIFASALKLIDSLIE
jgi:hypothetical protein